MRFISILCSFSENSRKIASIKWFIFYFFSSNRFSEIRSLLVPTINIGVYSLTVSIHFKSQWLIESIDPLSSKANPKTTD